MIFLNRNAALRGFVLIAVGLLVSRKSSATINASILTAAEYPTGGALYLFDPNIAETADDSERTVNTTRLLTQTFVVDSQFTLNNMYLLIARGRTGESATIRIFLVADTKGVGTLQADFDNAVLNGFLFNQTFVMPTTDPASTRETLKLEITGADRVVIPAAVAPAGYAMTITATNQIEAFTWRGNDTTGGTAYPNGRQYYDTFADNAASRVNRDFTIAMNATTAAPSNNANFDELGAVDAADLAKWKTGFNASPPVTHMQGDANADNSVDGADFLAWQQQLGTTPAASSVPEPAAVLTAVAALVLLAPRVRGGRPDEWHVDLLQLVDLI